jgi:quinol monooxygenase YgiN
MCRVALQVKFMARPGQRDALVAYLLTAAEGLRSAAGCELWMVSTSPSEPETVWVTEIWRSMADHDASLNIPGARESIQQVMPLLAGPPERTDMVPRGGIGMATS